MLTTTGNSYRIQVMVFVDMSNFLGSVRSIDSGFRVDWEKLGPSIAREALGVVDAGASLTFQGMYVYGSYDPSSQSGEKQHNWATNVVDRFPGVQVTMLPRQHKPRGSICPSCHQEISKCPKCSADMRGTEEKGVDVRIATDMIKFAWIDVYDIAVLLSSDRDFVPVVEFLDTRGIKTIHAAFPPAGSELTQKCWANIDMRSLIENLQMKRS